LADIPSGDKNENFLEGGLLNAQIPNFGAGGQDGLH
jgi:hypothetical protein